MTDKREDILERLAAISATVPGVFYTTRNGSPPDNQLPAIVTFDGPEHETSPQSDNRGRPGRAPRIMTMTVPIVIGAISLDGEENIGTMLNELRGMLLPLILTDTQLHALAGDERKIRYLGCEPFFAVARAEDGQLVTTWEIDYVLRPNELNSA